MTLIRWHLSDLDQVALRLSTLKEPYRVEGKKTMGYEIAEQLAWSWPDWIVCPTGGGTGIVGIWKACEELEQLGWVRGPRPRLVSVQAEGCAPIVRAFQTGADTAEPWVDATTVADGLRVPAAVGDILVLRALRVSGGRALAVTDTEMVRGMRDLGSREGIGAAPDGRRRDDRVDRPGRPAQHGWRPEVSGRVGVDPNLVTSGLRSTRNRLWALGFGRSWSRSLRRLPLPHR